MEALTRAKDFKADPPQLRVSNVQNSANLEICETFYPKKISGKNQRLSIKESGIGNPKKNSPWTLMHKTLFGF